MMMIITMIIIKLYYKRVTELAQTNLPRGTQIQNILIILMFQ